MPGIVGLVSRKPKDEALCELRRMVEALRHESFYSTGTWIDESLGVYVGWCALKGAFSDGMPLCNEDGSVVVVFSGEDFSEPERAPRLKERGQEFDVKSAGYLTHLYEKDPEFPACLNGRFQGVVVDKARGRIILFNDRYGMQRVYYHEAPDTFYFAAEAKAILAVRPEFRKISPRSLGEFVSCGCVLENRTLFERIFVLPCAAKWSLRNGAAVRKATYFDPRTWESQPALQPEEYYHEIREVFSRTLPRYFEARQPLGMSLTGGLDTRMILAWEKPAPGLLPCYTFGGMVRECQDVVLARRIARVCEQQHHVIAVDEKFLKRFPRYAERTVYLTDGCADVTRAADLYVNEIARTIAPVRMTGNYGGEVMRRVRAFKPVPALPGLYADGVMDPVHQAEVTYRGLLRSHPLSFAVFQQAPWHHYGLLALEQTQLSLRSPYLDNDVVRTVFRAPEVACRSSELCLRLIGDGDRRLRAIPTDRCGGTALHAFRELQFKAEYLFDYGMPQWLAPIDKALRSLHPERLFLGRHKFFHFRTWYRDVLSDYIREVLLDPTALSRAHIDRRVVTAVVNRHVTGKRNYTIEIHKLLTLELIHRLLVDYHGETV